MSEHRTQLLALAFEVVAGPDYNQWRHEAAAEQFDEDGLRLAGPLFYELVLPERESWETFRERVFPLLTRHLRSKRVDPHNPRRLIVSVFADDRFHLVEGPALLALLAEREGLDPAALRRRIDGWLEDESSEAPLALLPPDPTPKGGH